MYVVIEIYILICAMLLLFHIGFLIIKNIRNRRLNPIKNKMENMLKAEFSQYEPVSGLSLKLQNFLKEEIDKTKNLILLQNQIEQTYKYKDEIQDQIRPYIFKKIEIYKHKTAYEQAYYAYLISEFNYEEGQCKDCFTSSFIDFLDSKSIYVFSNAMNAICKFADPYLVSVAIQKVSEREGFYHKKLFIDGLLSFTGDVDTLHDLMLENFCGYKPTVQESLINYFRLKKADMDDFVLKTLKERKVENEVLYAAMRYFGKRANDKAKDYFVELLHQEDSFWVEELIAIQGLKLYEEPAVKNAIKLKVTSLNWHVRINAISYLQKHMERRSEIDEILRIDDHYANETLLYFYKNNEEMSNYILKTLEVIQQEKENHTDDYLDANALVSP